MQFSSDRIRFKTFRFNNPFLLLLLLPVAFLIFVLAGVFLVLTGLRSLFTRRASKIGPFAAADYDFTEANQKTAQRARSLGSSDIIEAEYKTLP